MVHSAVCGAVDGLFSGLMSAVFAFLILGGFAAGTSWGEKRVKLKIVQVLLQSLMATAKCLGDGKLQTDDGLPGISKSLQKWLPGVVIQCRT